MKIFGREPALVLGVTASVIQLITLFFHLSVEWQGAANALTVAVLGFILAAKVSAEAGAAAFIGLGKAAIALGLAWGLKWSPEVQVGIMSFITTGASWFARTQVTAPVPPMVIEGTALSVTDQVD